MYIYHLLPPLSSSGRHFRIMMQPMAINGAVANPKRSAPRSAAMTTSRPVRSWPSVSSVTRPRRPLSTSVWCVSARPISQGAPACLMPVHLLRSRERGHLAYNKMLK